MVYVLELRIPYQILRNKIWCLVPNTGILHIHSEILGTGPSLNMKFLCLICTLYRQPKGNIIQCYSMFLSKLAFKLKPSSRSRIEFSTCDISQCYTTLDFGVFCISDLWIRGIKPIISHKIFNVK